MRHFISAACLVAVAASTVGCPAERGPAVAPSSAVSVCNPHSVVLLRHAEKSAADPKDRDPALSPKGQDRAARLATLLGHASITRLVASEYKRTQQTLALLSERVGKPVEAHSAAQSNDLVRELRDAPPGSTTVVATHSNVIPQLVRALGAGPLAGVGDDGNLPETEYGRVLVLSVGCSAVTSMVELSSD